MDKLLKGNKCLREKGGLFYRYCKDFKKEKEGRQQNLPMSISLNIS